MYLRTKLIIPDAGKDWRQEEKGTTEDEMAGWHHWLNGLSLNELRELAMDREPWHATIHGVTKIQIWLSNWTELILIKTVWHWHKNRHTDQWERIDSLKIDPHAYGQLFCSKGDKNNNERKVVSLINGAIFVFIVL